MWPTEQAAMGFANLTQLRDHLGMAAEVVAAMEVILGSFGNRISSVAAIPENIWREAGTNARFIVTPAAAGPPPVAEVNRAFLPVETGQVGMMWRIAMRIMWRTSGFAWADFHDFDVMLPAAGRTTAFNPAPAVAVGGAPAAPTSKYKISQVLDQGDDTEFQAPSAVEVAAWNTNYFNQEQTTPIEEEEPTEIQVKALDVRIKLGRTPYVDFGIWGPYGRKLMRSLKFRNWVPVGDGSFISKELPGPGNYMSYLAIW